MMRLEDNFQVTGEVPYADILTQYGNVTKIPKYLSDAMLLGQKIYKKRDGSYYVVGSSILVDPGPAGVKQLPGYGATIAGGGAAIQLDPKYVPDLPNNNLPWWLVPVGVLAAVLVFLGLIRK